MMKIQQIDRRRRWPSRFFLFCILITLLIHTLGSDGHMDQPLTHLSHDNSPYMVNTQRRLLATTMNTLTTDTSSSASQGWSLPASVWTKIASITQTVLPTPTSSSSSSSSVTANLPQTKSSNPFSKLGKNGGLGEPEHCDLMGAFSQWVQVRSIDIIL